MGPVRFSLEFLLCFTMFTQTVFLLFLFSLSLGQFINSTEECSDPYVTIYNVKCDSNCAHYGENYYWCRLSNGAWDYCSLDHKHTRYGETCGSGCDQRGYSYYWCDKVTGSWDYCSPRCKWFSEEDGNQHIEEKGNLNLSISTKP